VKFRALSLFSGAGGMDIGIKNAGFHLLACVEIDPYAAQTLRSAVHREHRTTKIIEADIREIEPESLMGDLGLIPNELDLLFGGPPCQSFSQIGKQKGLEDERGLLLFEILRFAKIFQPKAILIEQVKGLLNARDSHDKKGGIFQRLLSDLEALNYVPKWQVINAADYGVAQYRERVFIVATRKPNGFIFPTPTHAAPEKISPLFPLKPYRTVGEALIGLDTPAPKGTDRIDSHVDVTPNGDRYRINGVPEGAFLAAQLHLPIEQRKGLTKKDTTKFLRVSRERPSNTLRCGEIFYHALENRYLTPREYMRIHGYPDEYLFVGPIRGRSGRVRKLDQHRQVANSVPPPLANVIADQIIEVLDVKNL